MQSDPKLATDLRRLTHLIALAEEGRFSRAAVRVHLSEAAFGRSIKSLEDQVGMHLFDRNAQRVSLTRAGEMVLERARALVFDSSCLQRDIELMRQGDAGEIAIGAAPIPAATIMPRLLSELGRSSPQLVTRVRLGNLIGLIEKLEAQELDFCLGEPKLLARSDRYVSVLVGVQAGALFCRAGHPIEGNNKIGVDALRRYGIAGISATHSMMEQIAASYGFASAQEFPLTVECDDLNLLSRLVADSDVIGLLPDDLEAASRLDLRQLEVKLKKPVVVNLHAIWLKGRTMSPAALRAVSLAQTIANRRTGADSPVMRRARPSAGSPRAY
ncbi:LysR family transcriptional regulator [Variovorax ginsengisoli]|uniref:LysR family transcriptional regulator n=1 Tax=Variovorax ginsengisoli TaxID=363844 RepID=A0ABT8S9D8_9BURK|nr:LysR family transcriptional regulator [Variovorax ginsengisoli]MDN8615672.1 LysR family transcriptional regulator [Variovorax ginsengisoli]MDO1534842.1 LysR family transcriptional regulator [Variovorax ginsengisoli]